MSTRFFTNAGINTLFAKLGGVFHHNPDIQRFDALVGYLRASGYFALRPHLSQVPKVRILVGIDVDEIVADYHKRGLLFLADPAKALEDFQRRLKADIQKAEYRPDIETGILSFVEDVVSGKLAIKAHPTKRLHAKIYIFLPSGWCEHKPGAVITGSSNLTAAGLGVEEQSRNYEFNVLLHDYDDVKFASDEFEKLWAESVDVLPKTVLAVRDSTYLATTITPYELYYKLLTEYFGPAIDYDPNAISDLPDGFKRLSYQIDAVNNGYRLLEKHNGFFLSDVVGLGKTVIACLIARKFFFHNGFPDHRSHTLIVCPPALEENWRETKERFHLDNCDIVTNGSLHKVRNPQKYDLIIVDEAHKFRNDTAEAFDDLQRLCKSGTLRKLPDGSLAEKKVILVSATPLNNAPQDIRNQLALFQDLKRSTLSVGNLQHFFAQREREFREARKEPNVEAARRAVVAIYERIRTKVISEIIVRRTRTDLDENEDYKRDLEAQSIHFPAIERPRHILYPLSSELESLYDRTVQVLSTGTPTSLTYNRYRALSFLRADLKKKYQNADRISQQLATIMRTLLVKRLDSSFYAFTASLRRFHNATQVMIGMFERGTVYIAPNLSVNQLILEGREEELVALIAEKQDADPTIEVCNPEDFSEDLLAGLRRDLERIAPILADWEQVVASNQDPKFDRFLRYLRDELLHRDINREGKLVVFSESRETTDYLTKRLSIAGFNRVLTIDAGNRNARRDDIRANFDANYSGKRRDDFDLILSTEVLAEGVNLHRANIIVNYDTPWNSTRLMQRIGRVNRIGSLAPRVYIYNFYPTSRVDDDIELRKKAIMKLQAFHSVLGEDSQIYSTDEEVDTFGLFEKVPEDNERDERLTLLMELRRFRAENPEQFRRIAKLPARCRVGRADPPRASGTVAFIRNAHRDAFYRIRPDAGPEEITFTEAAREFRATHIDEPAIALHRDHHAQVNAATAAFREAVIADTLAPLAVEARQGPNEKRARDFIDGFLAFDFISDEERRLIRLAKLALARARYASLQREINKLQRDTKKVKVTPAVLADKLFDILREYKLEDMESQGVGAAETLRRAETEPEIILTESFDHPATATAASGHKKGATLADHPIA
ncbi:MAG: phospholipase D-like domain-containing protein [Puniceicoccales bacterium]|jgi:superfamily II DNA or RNA helicase|nr:phospholipase D-like domain-containing protein [Puniceicoccales bacterium]